MHVEIDGLLHYSYNECIDPGILPISFIPYKERLYCAKYTISSLDKPQCGFRHHRSRLTLERQCDKWMPR